ncbi:MAG: ASKHA domain-containing protein, partial [Candidatus Hinthialibacter sp.]
MTKSIRILLQPLGKILEVKAGTPLQDVLFDYGVEFPCGGRGACRGCRVRVLEGTAPITPEEKKLFTPSELDQGWRLACRMQAESDLTLELAQWELSILADESPFQFTPSEGLGVAVDVGTTTVVVQLIHRKTGRVLGVRSALNPQAQYGSDLMSRIHYAVSEQGQPKLTRMIRETVGRLIAELTAANESDETNLRMVTLVGNTAMHNLFCGVDVEPLGGFPFQSPQDGLMEFTASDLGWDCEGDPVIRFLPCLGSFVGSDLLAGIMATRMHCRERALRLSIAGNIIDLGTNGEILVGGREKILCASTAAGPAFEGGRISMGMRASSGAISSVAVENGEMQCRVVGGGRPCGICGSGLVDAVAAGLDLQRIDAYGRLTNGHKTMELQAPVSVSQRDVRELQLAKGAIAAGLHVLLDVAGASVSDLETFYLAGAFGNTINSVSARRIGLFDCPMDRVRPAGNTALLGAKMALFPEYESAESMQAIV